MALKSPVKRATLEAVREFPNASAGDIRTLLSEHNPGTVSWALNSLLNEGYLIADPTPGKSKKVAYRYRLRQDDPKLHGLCPIPVSRMGVAKPKRERDREARVMREQIRELQKKVLELETWKSEALERFPQLAIDPIILEARKIASKRLEGQARAEVLAGHKDHSPLILAIVDALEEKGA